MTTHEKSEGHVGFYTYDGVTTEVYKDEAGELWRAPVSSVMDIRTGRRIGRWEAPAWQADDVARMLLAGSADNPFASAEHARNDRGANR